MTAVYVIQAEGGPVKVGVATDPQKRLAALRTGTPFRLSLAHIEAIDDGLRAVSVERAAHALLSAAHTHGEWFNVTAEEATAAVQRAIGELRTRMAVPSPSACAHMISAVQITRDQCRAARAILDWTQDRLQEASGVAKKTIADFEKGNRTPYDRTIADLRTALETAGVVFIAENGDGPGVRLRKAQGGADVGNG